MQNLVAEGIESREHDTQNRADVLLGHGGMSSRIGLSEPLLPVNIVIQPVLVIPVGLKDVLIVEQDPDGAGIATPDQFGQARLRVQGDQSVQEVGKPLRLDNALRADFGGVSGVECDPEKDEAPVSVAALFGTIQPAERPMDT